MIGYGLAKAAVHQLVKSLAEPKNGLPANAFVAAILPLVEQWKWLFYCITNAIMQ